ELRVLVGRAVRSDDDGAPDRLLELRAAARGWINADATAVDDDVVAGAERQADQYVGLLRLHQQLLEIHGLDIAIDGGTEEAGCLLVVLGQLFLEPLIPYGGHRI